jgi:hypothetical protein
MKSSMPGSTVQLLWPRLVRDLGARSLIGSKGIGGWKAVLGLHVAHRPVAVVLSIKDHHIVQEANHRLNAVVCKIRFFIGSTLKFELDLMRIRGVAPIEWPDGGAMESPAIHRLVGVISTVEHGPSTNRAWRGFAGTLAFWVWQFQVESSRSPSKN